MYITKIKKLFKNLSLKAMAGFVVGIAIAVSITVALAFIEPLNGPSGFDEPANTLDMGNWTAYGRNQTATTTLTSTTCEAATDWYWFEDGNGDGDQTDEEDGICVFASTTLAVSWHGSNVFSISEYYDNSYIASYTCSGSFPNGTVATFSGLDSSDAADNIWNDGDCALCQTDCYDGKKDFPDQGSYTNDDNSITGVHGPITPEVLKNWKGTRLPTSDDFFGFCGYKDGGSDYETDCSSVTTTGDSGQMVGRTDECLDLSDTNYEWLSEQHRNGLARAAGANACSYFVSYSVDGGIRFRAVFRP